MIVVVTRGWKYVYYCAYERYDVIHFSLYRTSSHLISSHLIKPYRLLRFSREIQRLSSMVDQQFATARDSNMQVPTIYVYVL